VWVGEKECLCTCLSKRDKTAQQNYWSVMVKRFLSLWLPFFATESIVKRHPELKNKPFVLVTPDHGRMVITDSNTLARSEGIVPGKMLADSRVILPELKDLPDDPISNAR